MLLNQIKCTLCPPLLRHVRAHTRFCTCVNIANVKYTPQTPTKRSGRPNEVSAIPLWTDHPSHIKERPSSVGFFSLTTHHIPCPTLLPRMYKQVSKKRTAQRQISGETTAQGPSPKTATGRKRKSHHRADTQERRSRQRADSNYDSDHSPSDSASNNAHDERQTSERLSDDEQTEKRLRFTRELANQSGSRKRALSDGTDTSNNLSPPLKKMKYVCGSLIRSRE